MTDLGLKDQNIKRWSTGFPMLHLIIYKAKKILPVLFQPRTGL